jgi:hypothetical protein
MLKRITLKLFLLAGLCVLALAPQSTLADGCGEKCDSADDGWTVCDEGSYRSYCEIRSHCYDCYAPPGGVCIPECTNLCISGPGC